MQRSWIVAACATALAGVAFAQASDPVFGSIACTYNAVPEKARQTLGSGGAGSGVGKMALTKATTDCRTRGKWDQVHSDLASRWAIAQVDFEAAEARLIEQGVSKGAVRQAWGALSEEERAAVIANGLQGSPAILEKAYGELGKVGAQSEQGLITLALFVNTQRFEAQWMAAKDNKPVQPPRQPYRRGSGTRLGS